MIEPKDICELVLIFPHNHMVLVLNKDKVPEIGTLIQKAIEESLVTKQGCAVNINGINGPAYVVLSQLYGFYFRGCSNDESFKKEMINLAERQLKAIEKATNDGEDWKEK